MPVDLSALTEGEREVYELILPVITEQLGVDEDEVVLEAGFVEHLKADSLDIVELIMSLEERVGIDIDDKKAETLVTVGDAVRYINEHRSEWGTGGKGKKPSTDVA